ncbi:DUF982 domain-containing protein [Neorhizobium sp. P12A]|uniref:DUF982 domain-containing protein n=1 Tax=Rhizobium/Agrobacterium group TaxID=227290 RepID=UPI001050FC87|nr:MULTISPECIES: DUF982 domain-containing protein [Rhizobium/Agrobacterium group]KAA0695544.1 DUF982 domain-containing protein [Neorhizobium sp. P12A]TCR79099.1 uncharacterized protein DUF982 [Rhizobium sp. BK376]
MKDLKWKSPVEVSFAQEGSKVVQNPFEALVCLTDMWPSIRGLRFLKARSACRAALDGRKTAEEARAEFIAAAKEARLTMH